MSRALRQFPVCSGLDHFQLQRNRRMTFADRPNLRLLAAGMAFLTYALAILWLPHVQKSTWRLEQVGGMLFAASYLFYDKPFGSVDRGLWDLIRENVELKDDSQELPADSWLHGQRRKNCLPAPS